MTDDTPQLTAAMAAGDEVAVETFYRRYFDWLYACARQVSGRDEAFCLDVVQESVLRIMRTIRKTDSEARLRSWLGLVVKTTALDCWRSQSRRSRRERVVMASTVETYETSEDTNLDAEAQRQWLVQELAAFDPEIVRMIDLRYREKWSLRKIGELLGVSSSAIDGRLRRAIVQLRDRATEDFSD